MDIEDDAFDDYFVARLPGLLRFAYLLTGDFGEAEDLTQTALARTFRVWKRVRSHDRPDAYVRRVMVNANARRFRRRRPHQVLVAQPPDRPGRSPELGAVEDRAGLVQALASLPQRQRAVVILRYCDDLAETEVAGLLGCSVGTVKSQASKGLAKLRTHPALTDLGQPARALSAGSRSTAPRITEPWATATRREAQ
ncbi:SigE family RNA polymerase sigma factor [Frankia sp. AgB1.9]|uniref:SigE family RNA polymerase sigma factor n=1 Tax=unclassified Frankia TaxID=2632575 RepID=UPI0019322DD6|nr:MULTISPECIES: SigE family RNA polymerase sigma factor [unclassified Frankia]MBL7490593.1 SigE family RNA polymerase sigma factor [Frankia sp. AgW1.1]MBL7552477.1 SigE family RNA polymerase sigma factor [Frankia sp. AgB1.9]MBL7622092.1 SigE family RNA polymerase sigma factor [Frankia sp. AgB1.8]